MRATRRPADPAAIALGQRLFFERAPVARRHAVVRQLPPPRLAFADGRPRGHRPRAADRNTPSLWNAVHERWYGWDGAADSLWSQAIRPIARRARDGRQLRRRWRAAIAADVNSRCRYTQAFGAAAGRRRRGGAGQRRQGHRRLRRHAGSRAAPRSTTSATRWRAATAAPQPPTRRPRSAALRLFVGRGRCHLCHVGPLFSNGEFGDIGLPFFVRPGWSTPAATAASRRCAPAATTCCRAGATTRGAAARSRRATSQPQHRNFGEFKVPSLRNVALTAPYMHDGQLATLARRAAALLRARPRPAACRRRADPRAAASDAGERADLLAFLETLSDPRATAGSRRRRPQPADSDQRRCHFAQNCKHRARRDPGDNSVERPALAGSSDAIGEARLADGRQSLSATEGRPVHPKAATRCQRHNCHSRRRASKAAVPIPIAWLIRCQTAGDPTKLLA